MPKMQLNFVALLGFAATALGRALPYNVSTAGVGDGDYHRYIVQTAGDFKPNNLASDGIWYKYQKKGDHYQCLFEANDEGAGRLVEDTRTPPSAASVWKGSQYYERAIWNWHDTNYFDEDNCNFEYLHLKDAFDALSLNAYCEDEDGHNVGWNIGHYDESRNDGSNPGGFQQMLPVTQQTYVVDGKTYKSTGGYYTFVVNQVDGAIIALDISSPQNAVNSHWKSILNGGKPNDEDLPKLCYMSDLVWGKWVDGNKDVRNLRVYAVNNVLNDETTAIVSRALHKKGVSSLSAWPGTVFDKVNDPEEFQALIGSPIGGTMSILLAQHKAELGNKEIYQVNVVSDKNTLEPFQVTEMHMFFQIRDVPPSNPKEEQKA